MQAKPQIKFFTLFLFLLLSITAYAQENPYIIGNPEVCVGSCETYTVIDNFPTGEEYFWTITPDINGLTYTGDLVTICWEIPGFYELEVFGSNGNEVLSILSVYVYEGFIPYIYSQSENACPADTLNGNPSGGCEKICAYSTVSYYTENQTGSNAFWTVTGAESYTVEWDHVTVQWGAPGTGSVSVETFDFCFGYNSICVEILDIPDAIIETSPPINNGVVDICENQTVYFENLSTGAVYSFWEFGDGATSDELNPNHTYPTAGTYTVTLIASNECLCSDTTSIVIEVEDAITPDIDCVGTICTGEEVTYSASADCTIFTWNIIGNGTITSGGGTSDDFITVEWNGGPEGFIELDVSDCVGDYCLETSIRRVPIISGTAQIEGPTKVCKYETVNYTIADYDATYYIWTIPSQATLLNGQGTNQITVQWGANTGSNPHTISVDYDNCYLECGGTASLDVNIKDEFYIAGPIEDCENGTSTFESLLPTNFANEVECNWTVTDVTGSVFWTSSAPTYTIDIDWTNVTGLFEITAIPNTLNDYCTEEYTTQINIIAAPPTVDAIEGPSNMCPGQYVSYEAISSIPENNFKWEINDGGNITYQNGNPVNVVWGNVPPYSISVSQISSSGLACESDTISLQVTTYDDFTIIGEADACQDQTSLYSADFYEFLEYNWSILPNGVGTVASGEGTSDIEILWHVAGVATIELDVCGTIETFVVDVHPTPTPTVLYPNSLCYNETALVETTIAYTSYEWIDEDGIVVSTDPMPLLPPGYYELIVGDDFACLGDTTFHIMELPKPDINISTPGNTGFCVGEAGPTLYAVNTDDGYSYQWYRDAVAIGSNVPTHTDDVYGNYWVVVTDENGCTNTSNAIELFDFCNPVPGGICTGGTCTLPVDCPAEGLVQFEIESTAQCNLSNFINTSTSWQPGTFTWNFDDPGSGVNNFSTLENPSHLYSQAGFYVVVLQALVPFQDDPVCWYAQIDTVLLAANFAVEKACPGSETNFEDLSTHLPFTNIDTWQWDFGDPASGANNTSSDKNPVHTFANTGTYTVSLTVTDPSGCYSVKTTEVTVHPTPTVSFLDPEQNCQGSALNFVVLGDANITSVSWDFGDPTSGEANTSELSNSYHVFENVGNYTVSVYVTNIYGCSNSFTNTVTVEPNGLSGDISFSPASPVCEGETITLTAPVGGISWEWSNGSTDNSIIVGEENVYTVTITDINGCQYTPDDAVVDIIPAPNGVISALTYNEYEQATSITYDSYETCEGEDVYLQISDNSSYTYSWSTGEIDQEISFTEDKGNLLAAGVYEFDVVITDVTTSCTNLIGPFEVIVHELPSVQISASPAGILCHGDNTTISVNNPQANHIYLWSTGENGTSIVTSIGGTYSVTAINEFGCEAVSNDVIINDGPDIGQIPSGCLTRCNPDTLCLPTIPGVISYQWYFEGNPIPAPEGTTSDFVATESGNYYVEMVDNLGCSATSDVLTLDLYDGTGTIQGNVYYDVNENGIIDGPDTLMNNVTIDLNLSGSNQDSYTTDQTGEYSFLDILSTDYVLQLDTLNLPPDVSAYQSSFDVSLVGCDVEEIVNFLCFKDCEMNATIVSLNACDGETIDYQGMTLPSDTSFIINLISQTGCDSMVNISVEPFDPTSSLLNLEACEGSFVEYNGMQLASGSNTDVILQNLNGCDSTVNVSVASLAPDFTPVDLKSCIGETIEYNGTELNIGDQMDFLLVNERGCDSTVQLSVSAYPDFDFDLKTEIICWNDSDGLIEIEDVVGGLAPFRYSIDGEDYQADPQFGNLKGGAYTLYVQDDNGCVKTSDITIDEIPQLQIYVEEKAFACDKDSMTLEAELLIGDPSDVSYLWNDGSTNKLMTINNPGDYWVEITSTCENYRKEISIPFAEDPNASPIYIPSAFSPNNDGTNDLFKGEAAGNVDVWEYELTVFNRWGNLIYRSYNINDAWNGRYKNKELTNGVYIWYLKARVSSCNKEMEMMKTGDITLLR